MNSKVDEQEYCSIKFFPIKSSKCKMTKKGKKPWKILGLENSSPTTRKKMFLAPTKGYKYVLFTSVTTKDAAQFTDTID